MSETITADVREKIKSLVWAKATELNWESMSHAERSRYYENWSKDKDIGGVLSRYMDTRKIRVYIKDSLLKPYTRSKLEVLCKEIMAALGDDIGEINVIKRLVKPHCHILDGNLVVCWGNSRDWKSIVLSVYERAYTLPNGVAYGVVFLDPEKKTDSHTKNMINDVASRLGITKVRWLV